MPTENNNKMTLITGMNISKYGKVLVGSVVTNASGIARFYLTDDGTATGNAIFNNVYTWSADAQTAAAINSRTTSVGANYVEVTNTVLSFTGVVLLGINLLGAVTNTPVAGATIKFIVVGD